MVSRQTSFLSSLLWPSLSDFLAVSCVGVRLVGLYGKSRLQRRWANPLLTTLCRFTTSGKYRLYRDLFLDNRHRNSRSTRRIVPLLVLVISDSSAILGTAYCLNFNLVSKCTLSAYHYYIAVDIMLFACSAIVLAALLSHPYYWQTIAALLRFLLNVTLLTFSGILVVYQGFRTPIFPEWMPPDIKRRNDSALILPASCFLDPQLIVYESIYSSRSGGRIKNSAQLARVGTPVDTRKTPELALFLLLLSCFVLIHLSSLIGVCFRAKLNRMHQRPFRTGAAWLGAFEVSSWVLVFGVCIATDIVCTYHVVALRLWAHASGWMQLSPLSGEDDFVGISQLVPILGLAAILMVILEHFRLKFNLSQL